MDQTTDDRVAVPMVKEAQGHFAGVRSMSFDKGFHSPSSLVGLGLLGPYLAWYCVSAISQKERYVRRKGTPHSTIRCDSRNRGISGDVVALRAYIHEFTIVILS
jgi:hypothetical protein